MLLCKCDSTSFKKAGDKKEMTMQAEMADTVTSLEDKEVVRKTTSLKTAISTLRRMEKEHKLRDKRDLAKAEREKIKKAKVLEEETQQFGKEDNIR